MNTKENGNLELLQLERPLIAYSLCFDDIMKICLERGGVVVQAEKHSIEFVIKDVGVLQYEYDNRGNINYEKIDRDVIVSYEYDECNRLKRVDNKRLNQTIRYFYDIYDNITQKEIYAYTRSNIPTDCIKKINYGYENGRLKNYDGEAFVYDRVGNPTTYRGKQAIWTKGRQLHSYNGVTFEYDGKGKRTKKGNITFEYDAAGNIISQSNGLEFLLDAMGVIGIKFGGNHYFYRKIKFLLRLPSLVKCTSKRVG